MRSLILMAKVMLTLFFLLKISNSYAHEKGISGTIRDKSIYKEAALYQYAVADILKATAVITNGSFDLRLPYEMEAGIYKLVLRADAIQVSFDILIMPQEHLKVEILTKATSKDAEIIFKNSKTNSNWYDFIKTEQELFSEITKLNAHISDSDHLTESDRNEALHLQSQSIQKLNAIRTKFLLTAENEWTTGMVKNKPYHFEDLRKMPMLRRLEKKEHYWDNIATDYPGWINSPLFQYHIQRYLAICLINNEREEQQIKIYKRASDLIINKFSKNEITKKWASDYLKSIFHQQPEIINHLIGKSNF